MEVLSNFRYLCPRIKSKYPYETTCITIITINRYCQGTS